MRNINQETLGRWVVSKKKMRVKHLSAKLENCRIDTNLFSDESFVSKVFDEIVKELDMVFIEKSLHKFNPHGLSMVYIIAESHIAIHTWPEFKTIDLEIVTCKDSSDVLKGLEIAIKYFKPEKVEKNVWEYNI